MTTIKIVIETELNDEVLKKLVEGFPTPPEQLEGELINLSGKFIIRLIPRREEGVKA